MPNTYIPPFKGQCQCGKLIPSDPDFDDPDGRYGKEVRSYCSPQCASELVNRHLTRPDERKPGWWSA